MLPPHNPCLASRSFHAGSFVYKAFNTGASDFGTVPPVLSARAARGATHSAHDPRYSGAPTSQHGLRINASPVIKDAGQTAHPALYTVFSATAAVQWVWNTWRGRMAL